MNTQTSVTLPRDASLFPEGTSRCSLKVFLSWMIICAIVFAIGLYAAYRVLVIGLEETGLSNHFAFGAWITYDLAVIALGAGAFFTGFLRYILNIKALDRIINLTVVVGFTCYTGALIVLLLEIGQPLRSWFVFWHGNVHSMLTEVVFCITIYCTILIIEYIPLVLSNTVLNKLSLAFPSIHRSNDSTLIFLDEIQHCPNGRTALKFLANDPCFDVIASGSLLGLNHSTEPSFLVGYVQHIELNPLDFEEFLWAMAL